MPGGLREIRLSLKFHLNRLNGFRDVGGRNLPFPILKASGLYNSLYYRTSRDVSVSKRWLSRVKPSEQRGHAVTVTDTIALLCFDLQQIKLLLRWLSLSVCKHQPFPSLPHSLSVLVSSVTFLNPIPTLSISSQTIIHKIISSTIIIIAS